MNKTPRSETRIGASETAHRSRDPSRRGAVVEPSGDIPRSRPGARRGDTSEDATLQCICSAPRDDADDDNGRVNVIVAPNVWMM